LVSGTFKETAIGIVAWIGVRVGTLLLDLLDFELQIPVQHLVVQIPMYYVETVCGFITATSH
jgi:hypothetical protein